jgi:hypothetical protein
MPTTTAPTKPSPRKSPQSRAAAKASPASKPVAEQAPGAADSAAPPAAEAASPAKVDARRVEVLVDKNPRRAGTRRHAQFEIIMACAGQTVATATERGVTAAAMASAVRHGWVRLVDGEGGE